MMTRMKQHQPCQLFGGVLCMIVLLLFQATAVTAFVLPSSLSSITQQQQQRQRTTIISCPYRKQKEDSSHPEEEKEEMKNHHFTSQPRPSTAFKSSSSSSPPISIQSLKMMPSNPKDVLQTQLIPPSLQLWLHQACTTTTTTIEKSDIAWLQTTTTKTTTTNQNSRMGDVLQISPLALAQELWSSLTTTPTMPEVSLQDRMHFRWEHQSALLRSLYDDTDTDDEDAITATTTTMTKEESNTALSTLLQQGQSNSHPLGYRLIVLPPHTRMPLAVLPALEATTVLYGTLCIQALQQSIPPEPDLARPLHLSIGTPLSSMSSPPTESDLQTVAKYLQDQPQPRHDGSGSGTSSGTSGTSSMAMHPRQYASFGSLVVSSPGTIQSISTLEDPCLLLVLGSHLPLIPYHPYPTTVGKTSTTQPTTKKTTTTPRHDSSSWHSKLFPKTNKKEEEVSSPRHHHQAHRQEQRGGRRHYD